MNDFVTAVIKIVAQLENFLILTKELPEHGNEFTNLLGRRGRRPSVEKLFTEGEGPVRGQEKNIYLTRNWAI